MAYINFYLNIQTINTSDFLILINSNFSLLSHQRINWYYEKIWAFELKLIIHFIGLYIEKKEIR